MLKATERRNRLSVTFAQICAGAFIRRNISYAIHKYRDVENAKRVGKNSKETFLKALHSLLISSLRLCKCIPYEVERHASL